MRYEKILVVDDDPGLTGFLVEFLKIEGYYPVENAANGLEGFEKYKVLKPDIVLMDMDMPIMNGYESCRKIKQYDPHANIIVLTGNPQGDIAQKTIREGYTSIILEKPFSILFLLENIQQFLENRSSKVLTCPRDSRCVYSHPAESPQCA